jgi:hypothetical protein
MRKLFTLLWLLFAVAVIVYHYDKGQRQIQREKAYRQYKAIKKLEQAEAPDWPDIIRRYDVLAMTLPADEERLVMQQILLAKCKAQLEAFELRAAIDQLQILLDEVAGQYGESALITRVTRETMGKAQFMAAWTLQEIGAPEKEYRPRFERARQIFRYLAEHEDQKAFSKYQQCIDKEFKKMSAEI